jgi:hypothetical protein
MYFIQHCFICRPSDSAVSGDAGIDSKCCFFQYSVSFVKRSVRDHLIFLLFPNSVAISWESLKANSKQCSK